MTWWQVLLLVLGVFAVLFGIAVVIGRAADRMGIPDDDEPSGPRVRVQERRTR